MSETVPQATETPAVEAAADAVTPVEAGADMTSSKLTRRNLAAAAAVLAVGMTAQSRPAAASEWLYILFPWLRPKPGPGGGGGAHCFLAGTMIKTPSGEVDIAELAVGDLVVTASGEARAITAIAQRTASRQADGFAAGDMPVRIAASAISAGVPARDLYVSEGHCLFIDGVLISAGSLVNGTTIARVAPAGAEALSYWHIDVGSHEVVVANGLDCETLLVTSQDMAQRFDSFVTADDAAILVVAAPVAPIVHPAGNVARLRSHLRSAIAPVVDRRTTYDRIRDRLADRGDRIACAA
ncbi:MAG: Hint domain-containing protein [Hyphomicrobiaceae bacterium]|nr:Hint domain-containing protein [Hyphomicrobiaceae bacterium]